MKNRFLKFRYILSILIDYCFIWFIDRLPFYDYLIKNPILLFLFIMTLMSFVICEDYFFSNASIGKRIMFIKIASMNGEKKVSLINIITRRILELLYFFWLFVKIDFVSISKTMIVESNFKYKDTQSQKNKINKSFKDIRVQRLYALLIDMLLILPLIIFNQFWTFNIFILDNESPWLFFLGILIFFIPTIYFIYRDIFSRNQSFGKYKLRLKVLKANNNEMNKSELALRNLLILILFPIEIILFICNKTMISERVTESKVIYY